MMRVRGAAVGDYRAPLFLAWQITNHCTSDCLHCCEESGPLKVWPEELSSGQALSLACQIADMGIPYAAFGGGEPLEVGHIWEIFEILRKGGTEIKIETNGLLIDDDAADRLKDLGVACVQVSLDGASAAVHERLRRRCSFRGALDSVGRLAKRGLEPEIVFIPTRFNVADAAAVYDLAVENGARTFVTGPMMRLGRAAYAWDSLSISAAQWEAAVAVLRARAEYHKNKVRLAVYPWGIQREIGVRADCPQAMMLIVPDGRVKLLNALPFAVADIRKQTLAEAWPLVAKAWSLPVVQEFSARVQTDPELLRHANECWDLNAETNR